MKLANLVARSLNFTNRAKWMTPFAGGIASAAFSLIRFRLAPKVPIKFKFSNRPFYCRKADVQAIKEVLVDKEYIFLLPFLQQAQRPVVLDIGSHIGTFGLWILSVAPNAKILSIEADPDTYKIAKINVEKSRACGAEWTVVNRAAGVVDSSTVRILQDGPSMSHKVAIDGGVAVSTLSLATAIRWLGGDQQIDIMKVDIEGSEENFLCTGHNSLTRIETLVVELHPAACDTFRVQELLRARYLEVEEIGGRLSTKPLLICRKPIRNHV